MFFFDIQEDFGISVVTPRDFGGFRGLMGSNQVSGADGVRPGGLIGSWGFAVSDFSWGFAMSDSVLGFRAYRFGFSRADDARDGLAIA